MAELAAELRALSTEPQTPVIVPTLAHLAPRLIVAHEVAERRAEAHNERIRLARETLSRLVSLSLPPVAAELTRSGIAHPGISVNSDILLSLTQDQPGRRFIFGDGSCIPIGGSPSWLLIGAGVALFDDDTISLATGFIYGTVPSPRQVLWRGLEQHPLGSAQTDCAAEHLAADLAEHLAEALQYYADNLPN